jgi:hypothetical protein
MDHFIAQIGRRSFIWYPWFGLKNTSEEKKMYRKVTLLTACIAAAALLLAGSLARAADPTDEADDGGGATASAAEMADICKAQAAKRSLTGAEADEYLKQCAAPIGDAERSAAPGDRREGQL